MPTMLPTTPAAMATVVDDEVCNDDGSAIENYAMVIKSIAYNRSVPIVTTILSAEA